MYDDVSVTTNKEGVNTRKIEIEVTCNALEINLQRDYI